MPSSHYLILCTCGARRGLPLMEAMSMGLPAIATNWSGPADFLDGAVGYPLPYSLAPVPQGQPWWFAGE